MYLKLALCVFLLIGMQLCVAYPERLTRTTVTKDVATKPRPVLPDDEDDGLGNRFGIRSGSCPLGYFRAGIYHRLRNPITQTTSGEGYRDRIRLCVTAVFEIV
ncbi:hypothetical protein RR48_12110 [Papilio machaon]|uniref:Secreted protein n=1 Tax=Papilio machaon TaxID=76193 RepID=A0A194RL41_PAPMA|nr:hypothetical protein RR48_12110 [Papilio machaon]